MKKIIVLIGILILLSFILLPTNTVAKSDPYQISGTVYEDGKYVEGAKITLHNYTQWYPYEIRTDDRGNYILQLLNMGDDITDEDTFFINASKRYDTRIVYGTLIITIDTDKPPGYYDADIIMDNTINVTADEGQEIPSFSNIETISAFMIIGILLIVYRKNKNLDKK